MPLRLGDNHCPASNQSLAGLPRPSARAFAAWCTALGLGCGLILAQASQAAMTEEEMFFKGVADINEGDLRFLEQAPATPVHHHQNRIVLTESSLTSGWARLEQCHSHIDAVPSSQIAYNAERIRDIRITRTENIGKAWVAENTVQMQDIARGATICIAAETRALQQLGEGSYVLHNGPYMRRFLDGYYPMRVSMVVRMQAPGLRYQAIQPAPQPGFQVRSDDQEVAYDAVFEGRLQTLIHFIRPATP